MQPEKEELQTYNIELPDTRPQMLPIPYVGDMPIDAAALIIVAAGLLFIFFGWKFAIWAPIAWYVCGRLIAHDYHALTKINRWLEVSAWTPAADVARHGGTGATPNPQKPAWVRGMVSE
jgi:hypothetical protein